MQSLKPIQWCRCVPIRAEISEPSQPAHHAWHLVLKYMHDSNLMPIRLVTLLLDSAIEANCQKKPGELLFHSALSQELTTAPNSMDYS